MDDQGGYVWLSIFFLSGEFKGFQSLLELPTNVQCVTVHTEKVITVGVDTERFSMRHNVAQ